MKRLLQSEFFSFGRSRIDALTLTVVKRLTIFPI